MSTGALRALDVLLVVQKNIGKRCRVPVENTLYLIYYLFYIIFILILFIIIFFLMISTNCKETAQIVVIQYSRYSIITGLTVTLSTNRILFTRRGIVSTIKLEIGLQCLIGL